MVITKTCFICSKKNTVEMPDSCFEAWESGECIQNAWPDSTEDEREAVMTGIHAECWSQM